MLCGLCVKTCTEGAIEKDAAGKLVFLPERCLYCGDCVKVCPSESWKVAKRGYTVRIGGKWGRHPLVGTLFATFLPEAQVIAFIAEVLAWYREQAEGLGRIRIGNVIRKVGPESLLARLRCKFPDSVVDATIPPQVIATQIGNP